MCCSCTRKWIIKTLICAAIRTKSQLLHRQSGRFNTWIHVGESTHRSVCVSQEKKSQLFLVLIHHYLKLVMWFSLSVPHWQTNCSLLCKPGRKPRGGLCTFLAQGLADIHSSFGFSNGADKFSQPTICHRERPLTSPNTRAPLPAHFRGPNGVHFR